MVSERTRAIVLRVVHFGEADCVVTLLSPARGKLAGVARGARMSRKRFAGMGLGAVGDAQIKERRGQELWSLESFEATRSLAGAAADVAAAAHCGYLIELARELLPAHEPEPGVFALLETALAALEDGPLPVLSLRRFELTLLGFLGMAPALDRCAGCGSEWLDGPAQRFDAARGGVVCGQCGGAAMGLPLPPEARRYLVAARGGERGEEFERAAVEAGRDAVLSALHAHLGRPLKSLEFIAKVGRARQAE